MINNLFYADIFKDSCINIEVDGTHVPMNAIEQMKFESVISNCMQWEKENLQLIEVEIEKKYCVCGKQIMDLGFSSQVIIGCIVRGTNAFIPNSRTEIREKDKLMIFTNRVSEDMVLSTIIGI